jgi:formylglycine-generating enzyme required for sulfatase activity
MSRKLLLMSLICLLSLIQNNYALGQITENDSGYTLADAIYILKLLTVPKNESDSQYVHTLSDVINILKILCDSKNNSNDKYVKVYPKDKHRLRQKQDITISETLEVINRDEPDAITLTFVSINVSPSILYLRGGSKDSFTCEHPIALTRNFNMLENEVQCKEWNLIAEWANSKGYSIPINKCVTNYPVNKINWYDTLKFSNALSEKMGYSPCYYTSENYISSSLYKSDISDSIYVDWNANGFRLPTEAEWELSAQASYVFTGFSFSNHFSGYEPYTMCNQEEYKTYVSEVLSVPKSLSANQFNLYDMSGNLKEWIWDIYNETYESCDKITFNPTGPESSTYHLYKRVVRGGSFRSDEYYFGVSSRDSFAPDQSSREIGFRLCRNSDQLNNASDTTLPEIMNETVNVLDRTHNSIEISWNHASDDNNVAYNLYLSTKNDYSDPVSTLKKNISENYFLIDNLEAGTQYFISVVAIDDYSNVNYYPMINATTLLENGEEKVHALPMVKVDAGSFVMGYTYTYSVASNCPLDNSENCEYKSYRNCVPYESTTIEECVFVTPCTSEAKKYTKYVTTTTTITNKISSDLKISIEKSDSMIDHCPYESCPYTKYTKKYLPIVTHKNCEFVSAINCGYLVSNCEFENNFACTSDTITPCVSTFGNNCSSIAYAGCESIMTENCEYSPYTICDYVTSFNCDTSPSNNYCTKVVELKETPVELKRSFYVATTEITWEFWDEIRQWAESHCFEFENSGIKGEYGTCPVTGINWFDAVKWCNALSLKEGLTPYYYVDVHKNSIYKTGRHFSAMSNVNYSSDGYRLLTEQEWEYIARSKGNTPGYQFSGYQNPTDLVNDFTWNRSNSSYPLSSVAQKKPNALGIFDLSGNVREWVDQSEGFSFIPTVKGGSFITQPFMMITSIKDLAKLYEKYSDTGFRICKSIIDNNE